MNGHFVTGNEMKCKYQFVEEIFFHYFNDRYPNLCLKLSDMFSVLFIKYITSGPKMLAKML